MMRLDDGRPGDQRGFIHKKLLGGISAVTSRLGFIPGADLVSGITGRLAGGRRGGFRRGRSQAALPPTVRKALMPVSLTPRPTLPRTTTARVTRFSEEEKQAGRQAKFGGDGGPPQRAPCDFPMVRDSQGRCRTPTSGEFGGEQFGVGEAVMGKYGAALEPGSQIIDRAICLRGMQLGDDGLCYNRGNITNKQRMWPAGRKPLLSGGDMRAIGIAARAGRRLEGATKRLQRLGMMKKPARLGPGRAHAHAKPLPAVSIS